eukprot:g16894.t1
MSSSAKQKQGSRQALIAVFSCVIVLSSLLLVVFLVPKSPQGHEKAEENQDPNLPTLPKLEPFPDATNTYQLVAPAALLSGNGGENPEKTHQFHLHELIEPISDADVFKLKIHLNPAYVNVIPNLRGVASKIALNFLDTSLKDEQRDDELEEILYWAMRESGDCSRRGVDMGMAMGMDMGIITTAKEGTSTTVKAGTIITFLSDEDVRSYNDPHGLSEEAVKLLVAKKRSWPVFMFFELTKTTATGKPVVKEAAKKWAWARLKPAEKEQVTDSRVPVTILTGPLGAGKTTMLKNTILGAGMGPLFVLENDVGEGNIDADLLGKNVGWQVKGVSGGCACCDKEANLKQALLNIMDKPDANFVGIVIELSGVADPGPIVGLLTDDSLLALRMRVDAVHCVADSRVLVKQIQGKRTIHKHGLLPEAQALLDDDAPDHWTDGLDATGENQIRKADRVFFNKMNSFTRSDGTVVPEMATEEKTLLIEHLTSAVFNKKKSALVEIKRQNALVALDKIMNTRLGDVHSQKKKGGCPMKKRLGKMKKRPARMTKRVMKKTKQKGPKKRPKKTVKERPERTLLEKKTAKRRKLLEKAQLGTLHLRYSVQENKHAFAAAAAPDAAAEAEVCSGCPGCADCSGGTDHDHHDHHESDHHGSNSSPKEYSGPRKKQHQKHNGIINFTLLLDEPHARANDAKCGADLLSKTSSHGSTDLGTTDETKAPSILQVLENLGANGVLERSKGFVNCADGRMVLVQGVKDKFETTVLSKEEAEGKTAKLVFIGRHLDEEKVGAWVGKEWRFE